MLFGSDAKACASMVVKVDLPTPPLPERIKILCLMPLRRAVMSGISGSGPFGAEAHIDWLGHPVHASSLPARLDSGPGQCSMFLVNRLQNRHYDKHHTRLRRNKLRSSFQRGVEVSLERLFQRGSHVEKAIDWKTVVAVTLVVFCELVMYRDAW